MGPEEVLGLLRLLAPMLSMLESEEIAYLNKLVDAIPNQIEKAALKDLIVALDGFEKAEIAKV